LDEWTWDTFNFVTGVIRYYKDIVVSGTLSTIVLGTAKPTPLTLISSEAMTVTFNGVVYPVRKGVSSIQDILIVDGENPLLFTGNGVISILYTGGSL
jgi:hypothetical protein